MPKPSHTTIGENALRCLNCGEEYPLHMPITIGMTIYREWIPFVFAWSQLEALYVLELPTGSAPKLYREIKRLNGESV